MRAVYQLAAGTGWQIYLQLSPLASKVYRAGCLEESIAS